MRSLVHRRLCLAVLGIALIAASGCLTDSKSFAQNTQPSPSASPAATTKICLIGNSHVTALRQALRQGLFADAKLDFVFWAYPGRSYRDVRFENGKITHPNKRRSLLLTGGRYEAIDPKDFDALIFVGPGFKPGDILPRLHQNGDRDAAAVESTLRQIVLQAPELQPMLAAARDKSAAKIYFVPWPMPPESSGRAKDVSIDRNELEQFNRAATKIFSEYAIAYIPQPEKTIQDNKWTKNEYSRGTDFIHMNAQYGALVLQLIRQRLEADRR